MITEHIEPWKQVYPTKNELSEAWSLWFESKSDEWDLFTLTVVFKSGGAKPRPDRWESEYKRRVLQKFRKSLEPKTTNQEIALPFEEFFYYEKDDASFFRLTKSHKPHHIHALLPIRKSQTYRVWSTDNEDLQDRLKKDIHSIDTVQSILVEKIADQSTVNWVRYVLKGKSV